MNPILYKLFHIPTMAEVENFLLNREGKLVGLNPESHLLLVGTEINGHQIFIDDILLVKHPGGEILFGEDISKVRVVWSTAGFEYESLKKKYRVIFSGTIIKKFGNASLNPELLNDN